MTIEHFIRQIAGAYEAGEAERANVGEFVWRMLLWLAMRYDVNLDRLYDTMVMNVVQAAWVRRHMSSAHGGEVENEPGLVREGTNWREDCDTEDCVEYITETKGE